MRLLGIDTGGTFTDLVYFDGNGIATHKVLSSPDAPERAILQGIQDMGVVLDEDLHVIHGSTVATNAVLEGKGARTLYITNHGFKDVLTIGRQARRELYNLTPEPLPPPVSAELCIETGGRIAANGEILEPLTEKDIATVLQQLETLKPAAVAINLLFSYLDARFEQQLADAIGERAFVSCSSSVLPVFREYERGITTWLNAYVGPLMQGYLARLQTSLGSTRLSIMRSSGQTCDAIQAGQEAVHLLLSGPAGGLAAAHYLGQQLHEAKMLTFDMGGTSTDVSMIDGAIELTGDGHISHYPIGVPMVNIHTIGAGGGSIAYMDEGGMLQVGPQSAGAVPGPACYGQGGQYATVTDANLTLGRIPPDIRFGEALLPDITAANAVIARLAEQLGLDTVEETASGIIRIANEHMAQALRVISVERGIDPREFSLVAFGGAGGLHVCELAEQLEMRRAIVPAASGVLSAFGMLVAEPGRHLTHTVGRIFSELSNAEVDSIAQELISEGRQKLQQEGYTADAIVAEAGLELCYRGQAHALKVSWDGIENSQQEFESLHEQRYGHRLRSPVELVNVCVGVTIAESPSLPAQPRQQTDGVSSSEAVGTIYRQAMVTEQVYHGPLSVCDADSTIWVAPGWQVICDPVGHLVLTMQDI